MDVDQCDEKKMLQQPKTKPQTPTKSTSSSPSLPTPIFYSPTKISNSSSFDRFIPTRLNNNWQTAFSMISENNRSSSVTKKIRENNGEGSRDGIAYSCLLKNELLGASIEDVKGQCEERRILSPLAGKNLFKYTTPTKDRSLLDQSSPYSLSPLSAKSQKLLRSPRKATRKISRIPFKVLDAPELQDDFYLNLVDWSSQNVLSVGLGSSVYLWSACTSQVTRLCDLSGDNNSVTSVAWNERGNLVAVGTHSGYIQIWDVAMNKQVNKLQGHNARVGALAWNGEILSSGSRDRLILQRDVRTPSLVGERKLGAHRQEVCGLKWSPDKQYLASGGNDNRLYVWNLHSLSPIQTYTEHLAAVKAIAWSPHHHGLLASGGGTADRCIRFWNTLTGQPMQCVDTGSQVCNLAWSKHSSELVSTHGYSQNQILVWKYPSLTQVAKLTGHSYRVLYLAMSPDGEAIVTGAGDETLRFWNVFSKARSQKENKSVLNLFTSIR
ncbi:fizzy-related protein homolog [Copidosoma floridanum]|uniref:fizzy-related protein homolog n=1 Tax=Copidosoma floridanum TaxID=29053 RepID=UPI0006C95BF2|nr:fizzy-related protein homolog [Copidosoma floridanum]